MKFKKILGYLLILCCIVALCWHGIGSLGFIAFLSAILLAALIIGVVWLIAWLIDSD